MTFSEERFLDTIFTSNSFNFEEKAIELFQFQSSENEVYRKYCELISCDTKKVNQIEQIPFLAISTFKNSIVKTTNFKPKAIFTSSGTTSSKTSSHFVKDLSIYERSFNKGFEQFYGNISEYTVLALLPSYLERQGSSLIYMANHFIQQSKDEKSGFFLNNLDELAIELQQLNQQNKKILLIGVSFALLDLVEKYKFAANPNLVVMETGGMKGRRKEIIREELHAILCSAFNTTNIHSEYGMTELLSQAYAKKVGIFQCPPWMKMILREQDDPFSVNSNIQSGAINVIDLANIYSCAFIATDDLGKKHAENKFEILGRFDSSDVRGCNLMVS